MQWRLKTVHATIGTGLVATGGDYLKKLILYPAVTMYMYMYNVSGLHNIHVHVECISRKSDFLLRSIMKAKIERQIQAFTNYILRSCVSWLICHHSVMCCFNGVLMIALYISVAKLLYM